VQVVREYPQSEETAMFAITHDKEIIGCLLFAIIGIVQSLERTESAFPLYRPSIKVQISTVIVHCDCDEETVHVSGARGLL